MMGADCFLVSSRMFVILPPDGIAAFKLPQPERERLLALPGAGLGGNGVGPAVHAPLVRLLTEVAELQREILRQQEKTRVSHARQFQRAIAAQAESLQHTLEHHSRQSERLQAWQKWTAGLGAAVLVLVIIVVQIAG